MEVEKRQLFLYLSKIFKEHDKKIKSIFGYYYKLIKIWCEKNNTEMIQSEVGSGGLRYLRHL